MPPLEFQISLTGNLAGVLGHANQKLDETGRSAKNAARDFGVFETEVGRLSGSVGGLGVNLSAIAHGGSLFTLDLAEGARTALEVFKKLGETVIDLGKDMLKVAGHTEDLNLAIKLSAGDKGAVKFEQLAESFGRTTRFSPEQIKQAGLPLLEQGLKVDQQFDDILTVATDLAARRGQGMEAVQGAVESFGRIALRGEVNWKMLGDLKVSQKDFLDDLGNLFHTSGDIMKERMQKGQVPYQSLLSVALNQVAKREGGAIGEGSLKARETLGGVLQRLANVKDTLFSKIAEGEGVTKLKASIGSFINEMTDGPGGAKLMKTFNDLFGKIADWLTPDRVATFTSALVDGFTKAVNVIGKMVDLLSSAATIASKVAKPLADAMNFGDKLLGGGDSDFQSQLRSLFASGKLDAGGVRRAVIDHELPHFAGGGIVTGPTLALVGEAGPEAIIPLRGSSGSKLLEDVPSAGTTGGGGTRLEVGELHVHVTGTGDPQRDGEIAGQAFRVEIVKFIDEASRTG